MQRVDILVLTKAVTYDEWPKMKRDTRQKSRAHPPPLDFGRAVNPISNQMEQIMSTTLLLPRPPIFSDLPPSLNAVNR